MNALIEDHKEKGGEKSEELQTAQDEATGSVEIKLDMIEANPYQPRSEFDQEALEGLSQSIKAVGVISPITVRAKKGSGKYQLIAGERRLKASRMAGLEKIPAYVRLADDQGMLEMALIENIQREDLDAISIAISYQRLIEEIKLTQEDLSERVGKKRATVTNYLRLLKLPAEIQLGLKNKNISMGHARAIINIEDRDKQIELYNKTVKDSLSVRKVEELARKINEPPKATAKTELPDIYKELQSHLSTFFKSEVDLKRSPKGKGKIIIPFKTDKDLQKIVEILDEVNKK